MNLARVLLLALALVPVPALAAAAAPPAPPEPTSQASPGDDAEVAYLHVEPPYYPIEEQCAGVDGTVLLDVEVGADGKPGRIDLESDTTDNQRLVSYAMIAVKKWEFRPRRRNGTPEASIARVPIVYELDLVMHDCARFLDDTVLIAGEVPTAARIAAIQKRAEGGNVNAMRTMGTIYAAGNGIGMDPAKAFAWFAKAAAKGDHASQFRLGDMYLRGMSVARSSPLARQWLGKAAAAGVAPAQADLGLMCLNGEELPPNVAEATDWFRKAARQGDPRGEIWLASAYASGRGVPRDDVLALAWSSLAARAGQYDPSIVDVKTLMSRLTAAQRDEAEQLAKQWKPGTLLARRPAPEARAGHSP